MCGRLFTFFTAASLDFGGPILELDRLLATFPNYTMHADLLAA
jgi:hypothetical protein